LIPKAVRHFGNRRGQSPEFELTEKEIDLFGRTVDPADWDTSDLNQKFAAELSASFASRCVLVVLVGQGRQCLLRPCDKQTVAR
jgi:hypothetical protein